MLEGGAAAGYQRHGREIARETNGGTPADALAGPRDDSG